MLLKLGHKLATKASKKVILGKETVVKAKPKRMVVRAAVSAAVGRFARDDEGCSSGSD